MVSVTSSARHERVGATARAGDRIRGQGDRLIGRDDRVVALARSDGALGHVEACRARGNRVTLGRGAGHPQILDIRDAHVDVSGHRNARVIRGAGDGLRRDGLTETVVDGDGDVDRAVALGRGCRATHDRVGHAHSLDRLIGRATQVGDGHDRGQADGLERTTWKPFDICTAKVMGSAVLSFCPVKVTV